MTKIDVVWSRSFRIASAIIRAQVVLLLFLPGKLFAQYQYLTGDPRAAQERLITDIQNRHVDLRYLSSTAQSTLRELSDNTMSFSRFAALGGLKTVCPELIVQFPNGAKFACRAVHESASVDWVVTASRVPEVVQNFVFLPAPDKGGPPAILPPPDTGELVPSVELDCRPAYTKPASDEDIRWACEKWPAMCQDVQ